MVKICDKGFSSSLNPNLQTIFRSDPWKCTKMPFFGITIFEKGRFGVLAGVGSKNGFQIRTQRLRKPPIPS